MVTRADYAASSTPQAGGVVLSVGDGSPADHAGIRPGDRVTAVDGQPLRDIIDWHWHTADALGVTLALSRDGAPVDVVVRRAEGESWGIGFDGAIFDRVRTCSNDCEFCFMAQLPNGMRDSLSLRDDDVRLSFLQGNFVTLTNVSDADVERIVSQALSPLYVSVHAVEPTVRQRLISAHRDRGLEVLDALGEHGIEFHTQIVLVPGVNDGAELDATLRWLAERASVLSVGVVPLGFTAHQQRFSRSFERPDDASAVLAQLDPWHRAFREQEGIGWVYAADEFYLNAGRPVPPAQHYDGFPQYENGIGIVRSFLDDLETVGPRDAGEAQSGEEVVLVTGELAAPVLRDGLHRIGRDDVRVLAVPNRGFGGNVSVAGLLFGSDVIGALQAGRSDALYLVPDVLANADGLTLDDIPVEELGPRAERRVRLVSSDAAGLLDGVHAATAHDRVRPEGA